MRPNSTTCRGRVFPRQGVDYRLAPGPNVAQRSAALARAPARARRARHLSTRLCARQPSQEARGRAAKQPSSAAQHPARHRPAAAGLRSAAPRQQRALWAGRRASRRERAVASSQPESELSPCLGLGMEEAPSGGERAEGAIAPAHGQYEAVIAPVRRAKLPVCCATQHCLTRRLGSLRRACRTLCVSSAAAAPRQASCK